MTMRKTSLFEIPGASRRGFIGGAASILAAGGALLKNTRSAHAIPADTTIRVGLIGCGGRGTGAAGQALAADKNVKLVAMGDAFPERIEESLKSLRRKEERAAKVDVPEDRRFVGFDAYKKVIDAGVDLVILATPPHFRPIHLEYAVEKDKHVFAEKPVATDVAGVKRVIASVEKAKQKGLGILSGLCFRYNLAHREAVKRIHAGDIGDLRFIHINDYRGPIWVKPRKPTQTDMEYQLRNWYYFTWLSGDFLVEQHVHLMDTVSWILKEYPSKVYGTGGRQVRTGPDFGNIYDHHALVFEYASGMKVFTQCRQMSGCQSEIVMHVHGTKGKAELHYVESSVSPNKKKRWDSPAQYPDMFQQEHDEFFPSLRAGKPFNHGDYMAKSTLMGIMARQASYTGQVVTWEQAMNSAEDLSPPQYDFKAALPVIPAALPGQPKVGDY